MLDIALIWDAAAGEADMAMAGPDLQMDAGLKTAVLISLFTDRLAEVGDAIPDGSTDRRGFWGDMPIIASDQSGPPPDLTGSRLWLLDRAKQSPQTLQQAEIYAREALQWMLDDGVAGSVAATASFPRLGWIELQIDIGQQGSQQTFTVAWQNS